METRAWRDSSMASLNLGCATWHGCRKWSRFPRALTALLFTWREKADTNINSQRRMLTRSSLPAGAEQPAGNAASALLRKNATMILHPPSLSHTLSLSLDASVADRNIFNSRRSENSSWKLCPIVSLAEESQCERLALKIHSQRWYNPL